MATYKVIQDIEAEDKLLGPLSLRQFIYAAIVAIHGFIMYKLLTVQPALIVPFFPTAILFAVLAAPIGREQSSEIWLLAKIRFALKPRRRIWDQAGLQELVTVTAPKKVERPLTNGLNETQVRSRLEALAQTIDTRGWVVKGVDLNLYTNPTYSASANATQSTDRLVDQSTIAPRSVDDLNITPMDDMLDAAANPVAQQFDQLVKASDQAHRQQVLNQIKQIREGKDPAGQPYGSNWQDPQQSYATFTPQTIQPTGPVDDDSLRHRSIPGQSLAYGHTKVLQPIHTPASQPLIGQNPAPAVMADPVPVPPPMSSTPSAADDNLVPLPYPLPSFPVVDDNTTAPTTPMKEPPKPAILELANNDDLSVATLARQANKHNQEPPDDEVVVSLH